LAARSVAVVRTVHLGGSPAAAAVDARTGRVVVARRDDDRVSVLDARSGAVRRTVDERTSRAFVVNYGGTVDQPPAWWEPWVQALWRRLPPQAQRLRPDLTA